MEHVEVPSAEAELSSQRTLAAAQTHDAVASAAAWAPRPTASYLLGLQRTAGNRAVTRMLARQFAQPAPVAPAAPGQTGELGSDGEAVAFARQFAPQAGAASLTEQFRKLFRYLVRTKTPEFWARLGNEWTFDHYPYQTFTFRIMQTQAGEIIGIGPAVFTRIASGELPAVVDELRIALRRLLATRTTFQDALAEGARILRPEFGLSGGEASGADPADAYDASEWKELPSPRGVLEAKVEPWLAMHHLVNNIVDQVPVPKAGGGLTRWSTDCFEYVILLRVYAYWRSMEKVEFNARFSPLQLGYYAQTHLKWKEAVFATKPGERPFRWGSLTSSTSASGGIAFEQQKIPVGKSWRQILREAPVGSQVIWSNKDATAQCRGNPNLSFCAYMNENTTKMGEDMYAAHPFGVVDEHTIVTEMAKAVVGEPIPRGYIERNIYISAVRMPDW